ncbi:3-alpha,7-alpha,12-alpha-trihydroxy-5-beta-cholest-24-enoyl-CoA hydratase [Paraburkholderia dipogonis]|uniref:3-alpha,7-alpha, 12-alpha-trihydroxy-5-beta-cholest-24-enoyl-CoA hydratase n=1 Tax=Paraburkholderia dipogonis TaxID=1211383 RepID=A0A4Y8MX52_9BURK|nr:MaoC/PaaZ C-terminal domain-containing protein [Paraburkholderia dipogonis]TFE41972.1 3-alpha,7-alpha,12-alpha-trihydroxy-5-beta-cholest-24-enoyl-CoA hydratase [Paraburkholderia dipogonis]
MAIDYEMLKNWPFDDVVHRYGKRETILYALSVWGGGGVVDAQGLRYLYEPNLLVVPSMAVVLGYPGFWLRNPATGLDWKSVLHVEQSVTLHRALAPEGMVIGRSRIEEIYDRGDKRGAIIVTVRDIADAEGGDPIATLRCTEFCRGEGGFGGPNPPAREIEPLPTAPPDHEIPVPIAPNAALLYRLTGDDNALHADPDVARTVGFDRPILHGMCTFGTTVSSLVRLLVPNNPEVVQHVKVRFSAPVFPGDQLCIDVWNKRPGCVRFRVRCTSRDVVVIDQGWFLFNTSQHSL